MQQIVLPAFQVRWRSLAAGPVAHGCALVVLLLGCVRSPSRTPEANSDTAAPGGVPGALVDTSPIVWQPGLNAVELPVAGQAARAALVWIPEAPAPRALVVLLHGRVGPQLQGRSSPGRGKDALARSRALLSCLAAPALAFLDPIIIAPLSSSGEWWTREDTELVLGLVLSLRSRWPVAGAQSVILGYSNGGIAAWYFARLYPEYFSAAIPMAFNHEVVGESRLPIYAIVGTKDELFDFRRVRAAVQGLIQKGRDVTLDEKYRGSHHAVCSYLPELTRAGHWLEQHVFSPRESPRGP